MWFVALLSGEQLKQMAFGLEYAVLKGYVGRGGRAEDASKAY